MTTIRFLLAAGLLSALAACGQEQTAPTEPAPMTGAPAGTSEPPLPADPVASTIHGPIRGSTEAGVLVFKGVRYGADAATTRFAAPARPEPWTEPAAADSFGASCMQTPYPPGTAGGLFDSWITDPAPAVAEDCLFLNVWTPALDDGGSRPVMVWFHGGGLTRGSGSSNAYDGVRLANRGNVVVVTVNHRLNVFGYTYLGEYGEAFADSGNAGILDMVQALEWVRTNAAAFGGDPGNVTIFGESGGGWKVSTLMAMEAAQGLFHRAIVQSGPLLEFLPKAEAAEAGAALVKMLGLNAETIDTLKTMPPELLLTAFETLNTMGTPIGNRPVLDGRNLDQHPFSTSPNRRTSMVPMLIGTTRTETSLFIGAQNPTTFELSWEALPSALRAGLGRDDLDFDGLISAYRRLQPGYNPTDLLFTATTDAGFLNDSHTQADRKSALGGAPTYFYMLDWDTPVDGGRWRSPHALEIGMVFDNVAKSESMSGIGADQQRIADLMSEAWVAFAYKGNPAHAGLPEWPAYTSEERNVMMFRLMPEVLVDPHGHQRTLLRRN